MTAQNTGGGCDSNLAFATVKELRSNCLVYLSLGFSHHEWQPGGARAESRVQYRRSKRLHVPIAAGVLLSPYPFVFLPPVKNRKTTMRKSADRAVIQPIPSGASRLSPNLSPELLCRRVYRKTMSNKALLTVCLVVGGAGAMTGKCNTKKASARCMDLLELRHGRADLHGPLTTEGTSEKVFTRRKANHISAFYVWITCCN